MTIEDTLKKKLIDHGLWEEEADAIFEIARADPVNEPMKDRWTDDEGDYPSTMLVALWLSIEPIAVDWLKANKQNHWALSMFRD